MSATRPIDRWLIEQVLPHEPQYLAIARRLTRSDDEAADLVQEALVKLLALDGWSAILNPRTYVLRLVHNLAIGRMRRAKIIEFQQLTEIDALELSDDAPDQFRVVAGRDQMARLSRALDDMPERSRIAVVRRRFGEEAPADIAEDLGISLSTLEKRLRRAIFLLGRALEPGDRAPDGAETVADEDGQGRAAN